MRIHRFAGAFGRSFLSATFFTVPAAALVAAAALPVGCFPSESDTKRGPLPAAELRSTPEAAALARALKARFPGAFAASTAPRGATVELPPSAEQRLWIRDDASGIAIAIVLDGAGAVEAAVGEDLVMYGGAAPNGGDLIHRMLPDGVEDLVYYSRRPGREVLKYQLDLQAAAGLRLTGGVLEVLDKDGIPIIRAAAPYVLDAAGSHEAELSVESCAVDTNPQPPFGRPVTAPGNAWCTVKVDWSAAGVRYPALVDPVWGSTFNTMATPRSRHTITLLNPTDPKSLALVVGGVAAVGGTPLKSAEIYDPLSRRFSTTGSLTIGRSAHSATLLATIVPPQGLGSQKPVLVAGGKDATGSPLGSLEVYDPASGTFVLDGNAMATPRFEHAAVLVADGSVLIAGGTSPPLNQPTNTAYVYTFSGFEAGNPPAGVASTLPAAMNLMTSARTGLAVTRLSTGEVLLTGGFVLAGGALQALQSAELFDTGTGMFGPIETAGNGIAVLATQRGYHTSTALGASGTVLVAGGLSKTVGGVYANTIDLYVDGSQGMDKGFLPQPVSITMATARANHSATLLPDGRVLVAGGFGGNPVGALGSAELFSISTSTFTDLGALVPMSARGDHAALLVNAGDFVTAGHSVLVTGGSNAPGPGSASIVGAQILLRINGDPCTVADECLSGFCIDEVCCDKPCDEECAACSAGTKETGFDGECGFAKKGSDPHVQCINQVETHTQCDGKGSTEQTLDTHSCKPAACGANNLCSTGCVVTANCDETGWCDLTQGSMTDPGTCAQKKVNGAPCYGDDQCVSAVCVDGVCCNTSCDQQCQACDLPGFAGSCQPVGAVNDPQDVHPNTGGMLTPARAACDGFTEGGDRTACTGACLGKPACDYPGSEKLLQIDDCKDDPQAGPSTLTSYPCNGTGGNSHEPADCAGFVCADEHTCRTICTLDAHCISDFVCLKGTCTLLTGPLCDGTDTLRHPKADGGNEVCANNYACPEGATACLWQCESIKDCITRPGDKRFVCNGDRTCVPEPAPAELPSCAIRPGRQHYTSWWIAGGLAMLVARLRRRRW